MFLKSIYLHVRTDIDGISWPLREMDGLCCPASN